MENLKVPYGLDLQGELVSAGDALQNDKYRCPSCNTELVLRSGEIRLSIFLTQRLQAVERNLYYILE